MKDQDTIQRFLFEGMGVRGEFVRLTDSWQALLRRHDYPPSVQSQLGQALAAVLLLAGTIKFQGSLILQAQGNGPLRTLVAQATHERTFRGLAHWQGEVPTGALPQVFGNGYLALTVQAATHEPYQGIVALDGETLGEALQNYFNQSEQLRTRVWLTVDEHEASGLFIQEMPSHTRHGDDWTQLARYADQVTEAQLRGARATELLPRLFAGHDIRLFDALPVRFRCGCSRERIVDLLRTLGQEEMNAVLSEQGLVEVSCEFCSHHYRFDAAEIAELFATAAAVARPPTLH